MPDTTDDNFFDKEEDSFESLFESYSAGMNDDLQVGDKIQGEIISIGMDSVFVDTNTKIDGAVDKQELLDDDGELPCQVGDVLELFIVAMTESEIRLSKALSGTDGHYHLYDAFKNRIPVEGKVTATCKGGFNVEIMQKRAFCPISQMDIRFVKDPDIYVNNTYTFLIKQFEEKGRNIVVSRKSFLEQDLIEARKEFYEALAVDTILEGQVTKLMPFGAFVELLPGIEGLIHISELSWSRVATSDEILNEDDKIQVKVIGIQEGEPEPGQPAPPPKIALSLKQLEGDPWDRVDQAFQAGDKVKGTVTRCTNFGAFVEIAPGTEGLVHISEMSYGKRVLNPEDIVSPGDTVSVLVKEVDAEKRRISLSIKDAEGDPWVDIHEKYQTGKSFTGTLEKKEQFGYFIMLEPGVTGLMPISRITKSDEAGQIEKLKAGDTLSVLVEEINPRDRKITLRPVDASADENWRNFTKPSSGPMGALGEKLQQALQSKDKK